ncbi:MAG TPA: CHASE2 domain-containing protein, partial [Spirochaetia bacterium]|nr:CHASE2 domain-containing protein [Spirochaetia bacterium]
MAKSQAHVFETRYFGLIIAAGLVVIFFLLGEYTSLFRTLGLKTLDLQYRMKTQFTQTSVQQGVTIQQQNPKISPNILIIGLDLNSLDKFGKWPWPRYRIADFINGFTRITDQSQRERALFLDIFFIDPDRLAYNDALLVKSIQDNKRIFLETVLDELPPPLTDEQEYVDREKVLAQNWGELTNVTGNWQGMYPFFGVEPPLIPYAKATHGYGHANFFQDKDATYRRQPLVAKFSEFIKSIPVQDLTPQTQIDPSKFQRLEWTDTNGIHHNIQYPLTASSIAGLEQRMRAEAPLKVIKTDQSGKVTEGYYEVKEYEDHFIPSITLSLAAEYFHKRISDLTVEIGKDILIPNPQEFDAATNKWVPYRRLIEPAVYDAKGQVTKPAVTEAVNEVRIPIDEQGTMLINFMGPPSSPTPTGHQTFPIRSFYGYAARATGPDPATWPRTRAVANDIIMVGAFAKGLSDEKPTPYGLMNGVEIHANALNTIITDN